MFGFDLPVWIIDKDGFIVSASIDKYGRCLLLFTDEDLATTAIEEFDLAGGRPQRIEDDDTLKLVLTSVRDGGDEYAGIDVSVKRSLGIFEKIDALLEKL